jgi:hypothetical protein
MWMERGRNMTYNFDDMNVRVQNFRQEHCGAKEGDGVSLGFLAEMAYCLGLELHITLVDPKNRDDAEGKSDD